MPEFQPQWRGQLQMRFSPEALLYQLESQENADPDQIAELRSAIDRGRRQRKEAQTKGLAMLSTGNGPLEAIFDAWMVYSNFSPSEERVRMFVDYCREVRSRNIRIGSDAFWMIFHQEWSGFDDTWEHRTELLRLLRAQTKNSRAGIKYGDASQQAFYAALPDPVVIYRGCSRSRVYGLSWTTEQQVAQRFANGHRNIRVPKPVIAEAMIDKAAIITVFTDRDESEILIDPRRLPRPLVILPLFFLKSRS